jgi:hypothetical protein
VYPASQKRSAHCLTEAPPQSGPHLFVVSRELALADAPQNGSSAMTKRGKPTLDRSAGSPRRSSAGFNHEIRNEMPPSWLLKWVTELSAASARSLPVFP